MALIQISNQSTKNLGKKSTIRFTQSICPDCNMILDAEVFERDNKVYMSRITSYNVCYTKLLRLNSSYSFTFNETSCDPADTGTVVQTLTSSQGCDSIITTITTLLPSDAVTIDETTCDPGQVGTVVQTLTNQYGCDSVVTTNTTLLPSDAVTINP